VAEGGALRAREARGGCGVRYSRAAVALSGAERDMAHPQERNGRVLLGQLLHHDVHLLAGLAPVGPEVGDSLWVGACRAVCA